MRRLIVGAASAIALGMPGALPAAADAGAQAHTGSSGIHFGGHNNDHSPGGGQPGGVVECTYQALELGDVPVYDEDGNQVETDPTGGWYEKWCGEVFEGVVFVIPTQRDPRDLAFEALDHLGLPFPEPHLSPGGDQVVNLATWLWVEPSAWAERQASVSIPGVTVTVAARPVAIVWEPGDGAVVVCDGPGTAYQPTGPVGGQHPTCSHTFSQASAGRAGDAYTARVTVRWQASWTATGAAGGGDLGTIERTTDFPLRVGEVQTVNTEAR